MFLVPVVFALSALVPMAVLSLAVVLAAIASYPMAIVPHPIGSLSKSELREMAMKIAPEIIQILTD